jgi:hypothetical protein
LNFLTMKILPRILLAALLGLSCVSAADSPFSGRITVTLDKALAQFSKGQEPKQTPISLSLTCEDGKWTDAWGFAKDFNVGIHLGEVVSGVVAGETITLEVKLDVERDNWIEGGTARYDIVLKRSGDKVAGTYSGVFATSGGKTWDAKGEARGEILPPNPVRAGFLPVQPGEHPRNLFRKSDLPVLRERAKTPFGKAIIEKLKSSNDPVQLGFLYQLTGDKSYAERAYPETVKVMDNRDGGPFAKGRFWGYRTSVVGNAYDLCYDAWTADQKEAVENYLDEILDLCLNRKHRVGTVNWSPGSNYTVVIHGGNGIAALALWGEKSRPPAEPVAPNRELVRLKPDPAFVPGKGVPTVPLPTTRTATEWLWTGPFNLHVTAGDDCLASLGGMAMARPDLGQTVKFKNQEQVWKAISQKETPEVFVTSAGGPAGYGLKPDQVAIAFPKLAGGEQKRLFFYNAVENPKAGFYKFQANFWNGSCFLGGTRLVDGEIFYLDAGRYPWLVPVIVGSPTGHASPVFVESTADEATAYFADPARLAAYDKAHADWQKAMEAWTAAGGINPIWVKNLRTLTAWNYLNLQRGMGDGGFQGEGEGYTLECHHIPHDFACAYQTAMGKPISECPDISHFAPRYIHDVLWNQSKPFQMNYGGHGGGTIPGYYLARSIALAPDAWKPVVLDHWLKLNGLTRDQVVSGEGVAKLIAERGHDDSLTPIWTFLNYPLDMKPQPPEGILPRAWEAKGRGYYSFRNGWKTMRDDIVASIYAKAGVSNGWNQAEAGNFQIFGLGTEWAHHDPDAMGKTGSRWLDNVVMLPEDPINANGRAKVAFAELDQSTGSGVVTIDMDEVYKLLEAGPGGSKKPAAAADDNAEALPPAEANPASAAASPITGLRSFAADYSGKSGAPAMFAVVDKIIGGKKKIWMFQNPRDPAVAVNISGNSFTLSKGDASLKATFISPAGVRIEKASGKLSAHPASGIADANGTAIHATADGGGQFFVVFTLQRGAAPAVTASGSGLDAKVKVGNQTVRFDGNNLVIGK